MTTKVYAKSPRRRSTWAIGGCLVAASLGLFAAGIPSEPHFADESAFLAQSYYADLSRDDPRWLEYMALDLPPLPKYLIGLSLRSCGFDRPARASAVRWYKDNHHRADLAPSYLDPPTPILRAARWPSAFFGALGVGAIYALGTVAAGDRRVGLAAALLLAANPLYRLSTHRAMADAPAEALILSTLAGGLWTCREIQQGRRPLLAATIGGAFVGGVGGLAVLAKLNGGLGLMVVGAWAVLGGVFVPTWRRRSSMASFAAIAGVSAFGVFTAGNPLLTAPIPATMNADRAAALGKTPITRALAMVAHRRSVSMGAAAQFPRNATTSFGSKLGAVVVQGYGRFAPLGPPHHDSLVDYPRYAWSRDAGALLWLPVVVAGGVIASRAGQEQRRRSRPPTAWAIPVYAVVATSTVAAFLPLAWDRYFLSIQPPSCLLAGFAAVAGLDRLRGSGR